MIEIVMSGKCENCKCADLEIGGFNLGSEMYWEIKCKHERACIAVESKTVERLKKTEVET